MNIYELPRKEAAVFYTYYMRNNVSNWFDKNNHILFAAGVQDNNSGVETVQVDYEGSENDDQWREIRDEIEATGKINGKSLIKLNYRPLFCSVANGKLFFN